MTLNDLTAAVAKIIWRMHNCRFVYANLDAFTWDEFVKKGGFDEEEKRNLEEILQIDPDFGVEGQCQKRFHSNWLEVRKLLFSQVQDISYAPGEKLEPLSATKAMALAGTGNWMTNEFLGVLYVHFCQCKADLAATRKLAVPVENDHNVRALLKLTADELSYAALGKDKTYWQMLEAAVILCPDVIKQVLASHSDVLV